MTLNDIKKALYKQNPTAFFIVIKSGVALYNSSVEDQLLIFRIPVEDMGDAGFYAEMPAKQLIRWISIPDNVKGHGE